MELMSLSITTIVFFAGLVGLVLVLLAVQRRLKNAQHIASGLLISYVVVVVFVLIGELYLRHIYSDTGTPIGMENWMARYWHENSAGFRDREWTLEADAAKQWVVVIGDSFAAGSGIENTQDRFSDVLAARLGDDYAIFNLGQPGTQIPEHTAVLQAFPVRQNDVVILQYFLNDIETALESVGQQFRFPRTPRLARQSYLVGYFYWILQPEDAAAYWDWIYNSYASPEIWNIHAAELNAFADAVEQSDARLIVVIFPNLQDIERSAPFVDQVATVFEQRGITDILRLTDPARGWNPETLMVSERDEHPSAAFHHYVGELLYEQYFAAEQP